MFHRSRVSAVTADIRRQRHATATQPQPARLGAHVTYDSSWSFVMQIGFIGLGSMGAAIATNLLAHDLCVFNRSPARAEPLRKAGATVATSPAQAARSADVVFTMVSDDAALESVTFGDVGIVAGLRPGTLHVSMSTIGVATAKNLAARHREAGLGFVSAPVFGRPDSAAQRKLFIMAAGADEHLRVALPLLQELGQSVGIVGSEPSQANLVKLIGNFMLTVVVETLGEACAVAGKAGVDPMHLVDLLTSSNFNAPPYRIYGPSIAARRFQPAGFALPLAQKDNRLMLEAAETLGVPLPLASLVHDRFLAARSRGFGPEHDLSALAQGALAEAGLAEPSSIPHP
jgi:3-hydroxyisobutyrate dehydrogenase-like beta-hydroxyacid dehydrogenase